MIEDIIFIANPMIIATKPNLLNNKNKPIRATGNEKTTKVRYKPIGPLGSCGLGIKKRGKIIPKIIKIIPTTVFIFILF
jgi:hypothetical protein